VTDVTGGGAGDGEVPAWADHLVLSRRQVLGGFAVGAAGGGQVPPLPLAGAGPAGRHRPDQPPAVQGQLAWADSFIGDAVAVITNVTGPSTPVSLAGTPVAGMSLLVPSTGPIGLGVSLFSYAGRATVSVIADRPTMPDCCPFARTLEGELTASPSA
jgi:hypothetical protein